MLISVQISPLWKARLSKAIKIKPRSAWAWVSKMQTDWRRPCKKVWPRNRQLTCLRSASKPSRRRVKCKSNLTSSCHPLKEIMSKKFWQQRKKRRNERLPTRPKQPKKPQQLPKRQRRILKMLLKKMLPNPRKSKRKRSSKRMLKSKELKPLMVNLRMVSRKQIIMSTATNFPSSTQALMKMLTIFQSIRELTFTQRYWSWSTSCKTMRLSTAIRFALLPYLPCVTSWTSIELEIVRQMALTMSLSIRPQTIALWVAPIEASSKRLGWLPLHSSVRANAYMKAYSMPLKKLIASSRARLKILVCVKSR